ncbi:YitT family protein [Phototrophicus methaneseepsis]|uniref:YitT family protein n=1 Tax=Phototrophicus methaneseepsis TaxID=2710758 RepID=A0A7S8EAW5_9CHLR|nr:YitT family protein [Phototrophicus methaneseepsis]QPC83598.1 YitT family protein [Phototrophicus methaneseepsis]
MNRTRVLQTVWIYVQLIVGAILGAISVVVFLVPADVAPQGVSGIAAMIHEVFGFPPVGIAILLLNIPIQYLGYKMLPGGWRVVAQSLFVVVLYSVAIDVLTPMVPPGGFSNDRLLNTLFGGLLGGISGGIIYRTGANFGGTSTIAMILRYRTGVPMSSIFLYTDTAIVVLAGFVYGIEGALYAMVVVFVGGMASDYVMEGPSVIRTAFIITNRPQEVAQAVIEGLHRGVTRWDATGMYTGNERSMLYVTVSRSQVAELKNIVSGVDEHAFIVIGQGHAAYGEGFKALKRAMP